MKCKEMIRKIEERYPKAYAMEWDNVGLLAGRMEKEVKTIYIALDATDEVIDDALRSGADMLITHHPLIFKGLKQITDADFIGRRVMKLIQNDISYYAMHTNYDVMGMAQLAGEILEMKDAEVLEVTSGEVQQGIGRVADLEEEMSLEECCRFVKEKFHLPNVKVFGNPKMRVNRIAISPGSGREFIGAALIKGADVLITGDIGHHDGLDAVAQNLAIIDAGHYGIEHIFVEDMKGFLQTHFPEVQVETAMTSHPFWIL